MLYAIGKNKIVRADNDGISVAEIHFRETAPHLYEITEVLTAAPDDDDKDLDKLMLKMVSHMRKHGNHIYTRDDFAQEWLEDHPESHDIWQDCPSLASAPAAAPQTSASSDAGDDPEDAPLSEPSALPKKGLTAAELPAKGARKFGRFLQFLSALLMLAVVAVFVWSAVQNIATVSETLKDTATGLNVFRLATLLTPILGVLMTLWILSRRRFMVDGVKTRLDCGRGAFPFAILLVALILTPTASVYLANLIQSGTHAGLATGLRAYLSVFSERALTEGGLAGAGLLLSIIRQFLGR